VAPPPDGNTGVETNIECRQVVGCGWLKGSGHGEVALVAGVVAAFLVSSVGSCRASDGCAPWYRRGVKVGCNGSFVAWEMIGKDARGDEWLVSVVQSDLDALGLAQSCDLAMALESLGIRWARIDVYVDDLGRGVDPLRVYAARRRGRCLTHVRTYELVRSHGGQAAGVTCYLGSRTSIAMVRVYRRWALPGADGSEGVRWEAEWKHEGAAYVGRSVLLGGDLGASAIRSRYWAEVARLVDFVDGDTRVPSRCVRSAWFDRLVGVTAPALPAVAVPVSDLVARRRWLARSCAAALATVFVQDGSGAIDSLLRQGLERMGPRDLAMIEPGGRVVVGADPRELVESAWSRLVGGAWRLGQGDS
jgi:hypothetical protein